jgi:hypothetical protein
LATPGFSPTNEEQTRPDMKKIHDIIEEITKLEKELVIEIQRKEEQFLYKIRGKKVYFEEETKKFHRTIATRISTYLRSTSFFVILTVPVIWSCIVPALILDAAATIFQFLCFPVYHIPKVKRTDYIIIDRHNLNYLNSIEKLNCCYCGYFNGLLAYIQEIAARTEQYWCPIKHARKMRTVHNRYYKFLDYGDHQTYSKRLEILRRDFSDLFEKND